MPISNKQHAAKRAEIERQRAIRKKEDQEERTRRVRKKKASSIPAKWYWKKGIRVAGITIERGLFYAGVNMSYMARPDILEPSLVNPVEKISSEKYDLAERLESYPMYSYMTPNQRRGYLEFLASDRTQSPDMGFVFLYLYGFERRLLLDANVQDIPPEERQDIVSELLRLYKCFGQQSKSLSHYITMLLLYDNKSFSLLSKTQMTRILCLEDSSNATQSRTRESLDNSDAFSYLLMKRHIQYGFSLNREDIIAAARRIVWSNRHRIALNIKSDNELYSQEINEIMTHRYEKMFSSQRIPFSNKKRLTNTFMSMSEEDKPLQGSIANGKNQDTASGCGNALDLLTTYSQTLKEDKTPTLIKSIDDDNADEIKKLISELCDKKDIHYYPSSITIRKNQSFICNAIKNDENISKASSDNEIKKVIACSQSLLTVLIGSNDYYSACQRSNAISNTSWNEHLHSVPLDIIHYDFNSHDKKNQYGHKPSQEKTNHQDNAIDPEHPLSSLLSGSKSDIILIPITSIEDRIKHSSIKATIERNKNGMFSHPSQEMIGIALAPFGWHPLIPATIQTEHTKAITDYCCKMNSIIAFKRGLYASRFGSPALNPVFGDLDAGKWEIQIPMSWTQPINIGIIAAWLANNCYPLMGMNTLMSFPLELLPCLTVHSQADNKANTHWDENQAKRNQISLFYSILNGMFLTGISNHALKNALNQVPNQLTKSIIFTLCRTKFGRIIPNEVINIIETLYDKLGEDKQMILHDYQNEEYDLNKSNKLNSLKKNEETSFSIDKEKLESTIRETSTVQSLLDDAIDDDIITEEESKAPFDWEDNCHHGLSVANEEPLPNENPTQDDDAQENIKNLIIKSFGNSDEMPTNELLDNLVKKGIATTPAEAMTSIMSVLDDNQEQLVDIDGPTSYLNA